MRLCRGTVVITDFEFASNSPVMEFLPSLEAGFQPDTWWRISRPCMSRMLTVLGFEEPSVIRSEHLSLHKGGEQRVPMYTYVARRRPGAEVR